MQITSFNTSLPLKLQVHAALGYLVCFAAMLGIYYTNAWESKALPFMSTTLRSDDGGKVSSLLKPAHESKRTRFPYRRQLFPGCSLCVCRSLAMKGIQQDAP